MATYFLGTFDHYLGAPSDQAYLYLELADHQ